MNSTPALPPTEVGSQPVILLVEDEPNIRLATAYHLRKAGYQVDEAEDGNAGWEAFLTHSYDLVLTDNNMPLLTGLDLIARMRAASSKIPVLLASGQLEKEDLTPDLAQSINGFLPKPYSSLHLLKSVARLLENRGCPSSFTTKPNSSHESFHRSRSTLAFR